MSNLNKGLYVLQIIKGNQLILKNNKDMRVIKFFTLVVLLTYSFNGITQTTELRVQDDGVLIPQGDHSTITNAADGLLIYDNSTSSFWYFNGTVWEEMGNDNDKDDTNEFQTLSILGNDLTISGANGNTISLPSSNAAILEDMDQDTYVNVEASTDSDKIEFGILGNKYFEMSIVNGNPIVNLWNSDNTIIGEGTGLALTTGINNTLYGKLAGKSITTGNNNIAIGNRALLENIYQSNNIAIGYESQKQYGVSGQTNGANVAVGNNTLRENTTGYEHTAIGQNALLNNTTGIRNVAVGPGALQNNTEGNYNVAVGRVAGMGNVDGDNNVFVGDLAGQNTNGRFNTYLGRLAGRNNTDGDDNVAVGHQSGEHATGDNNTSVGENSLRNSSGSNNVGIGSGAGENNTTGYNNIFIGDGAAFNNATGINNTIIGQGSGYNTNASYNTYVGRWSGLPNFTGEYNSALGYRAGPANGQANLNNTTAIGYDARVTASNQIRIGDDNVTAIGGVVAWSVLSDGRFKKNVKSDVQGLKFIKELRPVTYNLNTEALRKFRQSETTGQSSSEEIKNIKFSGFIAQEVEKAATKVNYDFSGVQSPKNENDNYSLKYSEFVVPLVKAVQELDEKILTLETENAQLKKLLQDYDSRLSELENKD